ncbi:MAG: hypothetical protein ABW220_13410 [Burkholderiaceae bacterium]
MPRWTEDTSESQLLAHVRISVNVGLTAEQLKAFSIGLAEQGDAEADRRMRAALDTYLTAGK